MGQFAESFGIIGVYIGVAGFIVCQILHLEHQKQNVMGKFKPIQRLQNALK